MFTTLIEILIVFFSVGMAVTYCDDLRSNLLQHFLYHEVSEMSWFPNADWNDIHFRS